MPEYVPGRVAELRGFSLLLLAAAFALMMIGTSAVGFGSETGRTFGIAMLVLAGACVTAAAGFWIRARVLNKRTMVVRGNPVSIYHELTSQPMDEQAKKLSDWCDEMLEDKELK